MSVPDGWRPRLVALDIDGTILKWVEGSGTTREEVSPAVKDAVRRWLWDRGAGPLFPAEITVANHDDGRPFVVAEPPGATLSADGVAVADLRVSLAHTEADMGLLVEAFDELGQALRA